MSTEDSKDDILDSIAAEAGNESESRATKELYQALVAHRKELSGETRIPEDDPAFVQRVHREAERRSQEVSAYRPVGSNRHPAAGGAPVPWWLILAWVVVIIVGLIFLLP